MAIMDKFDGVIKDHRSYGTNLILEYCDEHNIDYPSWLRAKMRSWVRYKIYYPTECWYECTVDPTNKFAEYAIWIMDELEGGWSVVEYGRLSAHFVFELEEDALAFTLRWI